MNGKSRPLSHTYNCHFSLSGYLNKGLPKILIMLRTTSTVLELRKFETGWARIRHKCRNLDYKITRTQCRSVSVEALPLALALGLALPLGDDWVVSQKNSVNAS